MVEESLVSKMSMATKHLDQTSLPFSSELEPHYLRIFVRGNEDLVASSSPRHECVLEANLENGCSKVSFLELLARGSQEPNKDDHSPKTEEVSAKESNEDSSSAHKLFCELEALLFAPNEENSPSQTSSNQHQHETLGFLASGMKQLMGKQETMHARLMEVKELQKQLMEVMAKTVNIKQQTSPKLREITDSDHHAKKEHSSNNERWRRTEIECLIELRSSMEEKFRSSKRKFPLWRELANDMSSKGYDRSAKKCREKWDNINKYYKKVGGINRRREKDSRRCAYFEDLMLLQNKNTSMEQSSVCKVDEEKKPGEGLEHEIASSA